MQKSKKEEETNEQPMGRTMRIAACLALIFSGASYGQDVPAEIKADQFKAAVIKVGDKLTDVKFRSKSPGLVMVPRELLLDAKTAVFVPLTGGRHLVEVWGVYEGKATDIFECWLVISAGPEPVPVPPEDTLLKQLTDAYGEDTGPAQDKNVAKIKLIGLYLAMVDHAKSSKAATLKEILDDYKKVAETMIEPKMLIAVRKLISAELLSKLGDNPDLKLDDDLRSKIANLFNRFAKLLGAIK